MSFADRLALLGDQHAWMEPQLQVALAQSPTSDGSMLATAGHLRQTLLNTWNGWQSNYDDPVLQKQDSAALALRRYMTQAVGPWPIADSDLAHIQGELSKRGFGADLQANGQWSPEWNAAYNDYAQKALQDQLAGNAPGSVPATKAAHGILHAISPVGLADHLVGFVKSLPGQARNLLADVAGSTTSLLSIPVNAVAQGVTGGSQIEGLRRSLRTGAGVGAGIESALGHNVSAEQYFHEFEDNPSRIIDDVGNMFLVASAYQAGARIALAAGEAATKGLATDLGAEAATRGPGIIARSLGGRTAADIEAGNLAGSGLRPIARRAAIGAFAGGGIGAGHAALTGGNIWDQALGGAVIGAGVGASPAGKWALNLPVLEKAGPWVSKLADADGLYYKARTLLAQPYRIAGVQAAGTIGAELQGLGLKVAGTAGLAGAVSGGRDPLARQVFGEHAIDAVDDAIRHRLSVKTFGHSFSVGLNDLGAVLHGPLEGTGYVGAGTRIENDAHALADHVQAALGRVGMQGEIERGMGLRSIEDLDKLSGSPARTAKWLSYKVRELAAWHYGELAVRDSGLIPHTSDWVDAVREASSRAWADPQILDAAVQSLANQPGEITARLAREITKSGLSPKRWASRQLGDFLDAGDALSAILRDHRDKIITPELAAQVRDVQDEMAIAGRPKTDLTQAIQDFADRFDTPATGKIGLATKDTLDSQQARRAVAQFRQAWQSAQSDAEQQAVTRQLLGWMHENFNLDARRLGGFNDTGKLLDWADEHTGKLAAAVYPTTDAPPEMTGLLKKIDQAGYKVVFGTDVGHLYEDGLPPLDVLEGGITRRRKLVERLGLSPEMVANRHLGTARYSAVRREIQGLVDAGKIKLPPYYTVDTVLADLSDDELLARNLPLLERVAFAGTEPLHRRAAQQLARRAGRDVEGLSLDEAALAQIKKEIASSLHLRDIPRKDVLRVLTRTDNLPWPVAEGDGTPLMDTESANQLYRAVIRGAAKVPTRMAGWQRVEDIARASMGFLGDVIPGQTGEAIANLPNRLVQVRNRLRFEVNPEFAFRRVAKTNLKMGLEGIVPTWRPLDAMVEGSYYDKAHELLDRLEPTFANRNLVESERYLHASDVFGLYNQRQYEAYAAWQWKQAGLSDDEIKNKLVRVFSYGSGGVAGRSALERSTNMVFFPFSFDKTLYRNVGAYLLDRPAQLIALTRGLDAYRQFNDSHQDGSNPLAASWWESHVPLLNEALRLNAFAHGISAGEFGGINAPLLNAFLPQSWDTNEHTQATLKRFIPAIGELQRVMKEGGEQIGIANTALHNSVDATARWLEGRPRDALNPRPAAATRQAQLDGAFTMRGQLINQLRSALDYNALHSDPQDKYRFPNDPAYGDLAGEIVNRENIGWIVHRYYPAFNPTTAVEFAIRKQTDLQTWLRSLKASDPERYKVYSNFFDEAVKAAGYLNEDRYTAEQAREVTSQFRQAAVILAEDNATFYRRYNKHLRSYFGPLEGLR